LGVRARVSSIIAFLRAGYPSGAPRVGYVPLLALLRRRVSDDEIVTITSLFAPRARPIDRVDVGVEITRVTEEMPSFDDIERVHRGLDAVRLPKGWAGGNSG
jgi:uncharacterized protein DUF3349